MHGCTVPSAKSLSELATNTISAFRRPAVIQNTQKLPEEVDFVACFLKDGALAKIFIQLKQPYQAKSFSYTLLMFDCETQSLLTLSCDFTIKVICAIQH
jgi:hypothetical protein